ncbi:ammonia-dependent NAD(+) synthetase [Noviherbaspirillum agri]
MDKRVIDKEQQQLIAELNVAATFNARTELDQRIAFLCDLLISTRRRTFVLGISGGVDSLAAGCLAQAAVDKARAQGYDARFIAMRLPYGVQRDEEDAQRSLAVIKPDEILTVDIKPASDAMLAAVKASSQSFKDAAHEDFILGNIKARQRMIAQYAVAGATDGLVIGTDQAAEALMGFFTKHGDGAADVTPLTGLTKRRVRAIAAEFGAPQDLVYKVPTADLENLAPLKPDEDAFGVSYELIDDFLEGKQISEEARAIILRQFQQTAHKRTLPVTPPQGDG